MWGRARQTSAQGAAQSHSMAIAQLVYCSYHTTFFFFFFFSSIRVLHPCTQSDWCKDKATTCRIHEGILHNVYLFCLTSAAERLLLQAGMPHSRQLEKHTCKYHEQQFLEVFNIDNSREELQTHSQYNGCVYTGAYERREAALISSRYGLLVYIFPSARISHGDK